MAHKDNYDRPRLLSDGAGDDAEVCRSQATLLCDVSEPRGSRELRKGQKPLQRKDISLAEEVRETRPDESGYAVLDVRPDGAGELVLVVMSCPSENDSPDGRGRVTVRLLVEQYAALSPKRGAISPAQADALCRAGQLAEAIRHAMVLLQFGDQSERRLMFKLTAKGIERAVAEEAVAYLADKGLIAEDRGAVRRAEQDARKLWGPRRIREDLRAQGYERKSIESAMLALEDAEVDFAQNCALVIRRKWGALPTDRAARAKCRASLLRLGYEAETVREAERRLGDGSF